MNADISGRWALISVSDKSGVVPFAKSLVDAGYRILSTGGTARHLMEAGVEVTKVADVTGFPEIMNGRVKTLHPRIHGALLGRRPDPSHVDAMKAHGIPDIRLVAVNLYPFRQTIARDGVTLPEAIEQIDIGGPTMVRATAKNHESVSIVVDPTDYDEIAATLPDGPDEQLRRRLALKAFRHTAAYDAAICEYLEGHVDTASHGVNLALEATETLRYGENPHQEAWLLHGSGASPYGGIEQLHGKALSYNNIVDLDAALELVAEFDRPAVAVIKHTNPAGVAEADDISTAFTTALAGDPMSAFGGIFAFNGEVPADVAEVINEGFYEIVAAPAFSADALEILSQKKNIRLLQVPDGRFKPTESVRATSLGYLVQTVDPRIELDLSDCEVPTERKPSDDEWNSLKFAWRVCKHVKSNAIVIAEGTRSLGVGAGQMSRIDSVKIASEKRRENPDGQVLASDAFFPFRDGIDAAAAAGVKAIIQPGGSRRDQEVIDACNEHGISMVFTGKRHFRH